LTRFGGGKGEAFGSEKRGQERLVRIRKGKLGKRTKESFRENFPKLFKL